MSILPSVYVEALGFDVLFSVIVTRTIPIILLGRTDREDRFSQRETQ